MNVATIPYPDPEENFVRIDKFMGMPKQLLNTRSKEDYVGLPAQLNNTDADWKLSIGLRWELKDRLTEGISHRIIERLKDESDII